MVSAVITSEPLQGPHDVVPVEDDVDDNLRFDSQGNVLPNSCLGLPLGSPLAWINSVIELRRYHVVM